MEWSSCCTTKPETQLQLARIICRCAIYLMLRDLTGENSLLQHIQQGENICKPSKKHPLPEM